MYEHVEAASERWKQAKDATREARAELVEAVTAARSQGASLGDLADVLGISRERVRQMTGDHDDRIPIESVNDVGCPKCGAEPGERCKARPGTWAHMERYGRRQEAHKGTADFTEAESGALLARLTAPTTADRNRQVMADYANRLRGQ